MHVKKEGLKNMYFLHLIKSLNSKSDELHMHFSYQHCLGLMLREDYRALAAVIVEPGRALLNNFNSEKLETCHHCCLDHQRNTFFLLRIEPIADLVSWIRMPLTAEMGG